MTLLKGTKDVLYTSSVLLDVLRDPSDAKPSAAPTTPSKIQSSPSMFADYGLSINQH